MRGAEPEHGAPAGVVDEEAAQQQACAGAEGGHRGEPADCDRYSGRRQVFAHDADSQRQQRRRHALQRAAQDQAGQFGGQRADERARRGTRQHGQHHALAAEQVAQPRGEARRHRAHQEVARDEPARADRIGELARNGRQGGVDHADLEGGDDLGDHQHGEKRESAAPAGRFSDGVERHGGTPCVRAFPATVTACRLGSASTTSTDKAAHTLTAPSASR